MERRPKRKMEKLEEPLFTELTPRESERVAGGAAEVTYSYDIALVNGEVMYALDPQVKFSF